MNIIRRTAILTFVLALCSSCAAPIRPEKLSQSDLAAAPAHGLIVGSIVHGKEKPVYTSAGLTFFQQNGEARKHVSLGMDQLAFLASYKDEFQDGEESGSLFVFQVPAGSYAFKHISVAMIGYMGAESHWRNKEPFFIPFDVASGRITYIGEIKFIPVTGKNLFGFEVPAGGYFTFSDSARRDVQKLKAAYPDLDWRNLEVKVIRQGDVDPSLVRFE